MTALLIVGAGVQGQRHIRCARNMDEITSITVVDPAPVDLGDGLIRVGTIAEALSLGTIDAAVVATPTHLHRCAAIGLLAAGVPTLVEKPLAATVDDAAAVVAAARSSGSLLAVGHVERFNPAVRLVGAMLGKGALGVPIDISFRRLGLPPRNAPTIDVILDLGVHDIDVFCGLVGDTARLAGCVTWPASGRVESAHLLLEGGGTTGSVTVNWRTPVRVREFTVTTDECFVEVNYTTQSVGVTQATMVSEWAEFSEFQSHYGAARRTNLEVRPSEPLPAQLAAFLHAASTGEMGGLASGDDALAAIAIAAEASESAYVSAP